MHNQATIDLLLAPHTGRTRPLRCLAQPPLQLSRVRYDNPASPAQANLTLVHLGGVLAGDHYQLNVELAAEANARITSAAATQVYRMPQGNASQQLCLRLGANSQLYWLPEPLILFGGARFRQATHVELAAGAQLVLLDVLVPGRLARGECFQFEAYHAQLDVYDAGGRLVVAEYARLTPASLPLLVPGVLATAPVVGSLYLFGIANPDQAASLVNQQRTPTLAATSLPHGCGLLIRALGSAPTAVRASLLHAWATLA